MKIYFKICSTLLYVIKGCDLIIYPFIDISCNWTSESQRGVFDGDTSRKNPFKAILKRVKEELHLIILIVFVYFFMRI